GRRMGSIARSSSRGGIASPARPWHPRRMPDYSLFGNEHVQQYETTGGKVGHDWNGTACLILHTTGRKSGETRKFPLIYGRDGDDQPSLTARGSPAEADDSYRRAGVAALRLFRPTPKTRTPPAFAGRAALATAPDADSRCSRKTSSSCSRAGETGTASSRLRI